MLLKDKVCMVAGAGSLRGIGYATAKLFAEQGAKVVIVDIAIDDEAVESLRRLSFSGSGHEVHVDGFACDITSLANCKRVVDEVVALHGTVNALVNCAGVVRGTPTLDIEPSEYEQIMAVNLRGTFNLCQSVLPVLVAQGGGSVVNLSSSAAQRGGGLVGGAHYAASKAGVIGLTRTIAREFGANGVRANIVCPAMIATTMLDGVPAERLQDFITAVPLQRAGTPREVAGACLFLVSELGGFVTGATIDVNGGSHIH
jgi:NAD(P)-dependent dehydrogenase (short-subunit alcohol dehydrogenase family)